MPTAKCDHELIRCINHHDLIRKYQCASCGEVMMCECDQSIGETFLSHQLRKGTDANTKRSVPVTIGFQPQVCDECRGLSPEAHPTASCHGRTSKIKRYYWRELFFREMELFTDWARDNGSSLFDDRPEAKAVREACAEQALKDIKTLHAKSPKYSFSEESQSEFLARYPVEVIDLHGLYLPPQNGRRCQIVDDGQCFAPEAFVQRHFTHLGYESVAVESIPFHVLFGIFMWPLMCDNEDSLVECVGFGDRNAFEEKRTDMPPIYTLLPSDFGSSAYGTRRTQAIDTPFAEMIGDEDLGWLFDYWLPYSGGLRQYLWAHREEHIGTARRLLAILPSQSIVRILRYLVDDYWGRYLGWPDLLAFKGNEFFFAEVKASGDKLSEEQRAWIQGNVESLHLPFKLVKIHKRGIYELEMP